MVIAGIDYSMSSPSICILGEDFESSKFFYLTRRKKLTGKFKNINGIYIDKWESNEERFDMISYYMMKQIFKHNVKFVGLEGYAMGAKGQVFNIGENTGLLKHKLFKENIKFDVIAPTQIKKFATGKGNANKIKMYESFFEQTNVDLEKRLLEKCDKNPISDIVDSYFIALYTKNKLNKT